MRISSSARLAPAAGCDALHLERELDVLADRAVREQRQRLEHEAGRPPVRRQVVDPLAAQQDVAVAGRLHAGQHAQQRGLARARRADDGEELALAHRRGRRGRRRSRRSSCANVASCTPDGQLAPEVGGVAAAQAGRQSRSGQPRQPRARAWPRSSGRAPCRSRARCRTRPSAPSPPPGCPTGSRPAPRA